MSAPQFIIARRQEAFERAKELFPNKQVSYQNGGDDWSAFTGARLVIIGDDPIPIFAWVATEIKVVPFPPADLQPDGALAWAKAEARLAERPLDTVQPGATAGPEPVAEAGTPVPAEALVVPDPIQGAESHGNDAEAGILRQNVPAAVQRTAGQGTLGRLQPEGGYPVQVPDVLQLGPPGSGSLHGPDLPAVAVQAVQAGREASAGTESQEGVYLGAEDAAVLTRRLEQAAALEALLKRRDELEKIAPTVLIPDADPQDEYDAELQAEASVRSAAWERPLLTRENEPWPAPLDFWDGTAGLPTVQPEWLPPSMADYLLDQSALRGVDPAQAAISCPVIWSALIRESISLKMMADSHGWQERARLWGAVVGDPSTRKGVGIQIADTHFKHLALQFRASEEAASTEYFHAEKMYQRDLADYYRESKKNPAMQRPPAPERPASNRLWTDDATLESLGKLLSSHARGKLLVDKDELSGWFGAFDAFGNGKTDKDRPAYLSSYEGGEKYIDRVTDGKAFHIPTWSLCILGGIQPSVLAGIAAKLGADGMLQRFMIANSKAATENEERPEDRLAAARWQKVCDGLLDMDPHPSGPVRFSPEAQELRRECSRWIQKAMKAGFEPPLQAALGKFEGLLGRLALVSHCAQSADKGLPVPEQEIAESTLAQCWDYVREFLWPHAMAFYNVTLGTEERLPTRKVASLLLVHPSDTVVQSDIGHAWTGWRRITPIQKRETLAALCEYGWLRAEPDGQHWAIRPGIRAMFAERYEQVRAERSSQAALMPLKMPNKFRRELGCDD